MGCLQCIIFLGSALYVMNVKANSKSDLKIVGGEPTTINQFPHQIPFANGRERASGFALSQTPSETTLYRLDDPSGPLKARERFPVSFSSSHKLSMLSKGSHHCGAALISPVWILSAAHCVAGHDKRKLSLLGGVTSLWDSRAQVRKIVEVVKHDMFDKLDYDIALLKVYPPFQLNEKIYPIRLPEAGVELSEGATVTVTGWGATSENGSATSNLRRVDLTVITPQQCEESLSPIGIHEETMLCTWFPGGGKDACQGDSGGPLLHDNVLVGIVSWGIGCARAGNAGVFTKVSHFRDWIFHYSGV